jgi:radical SAM superfamily enzyme YgiQ (UPF0313 family)
LAYKSGCKILLIGFESLDETNLQVINSSNWKMRRLSNYGGVVKNLQENGIIVYAAFIIGHDNDDNSTFERIKKFMLENNCTGQFTILTPLPGSDLYEQLKNEGRLFETRFWNKCNFFDVVFKHPKMSSEEIEKGLVWLYKEVFSSRAFESRYKYMKEIYKNLPDRWTM